MSQQEAFELKNVVGKGHGKTSGGPHPARPHLIGPPDEHGVKLLPIGRW